jgi:hypothetical protein
VDPNGWRLSVSSSPDVGADADSAQVAGGVLVIAREAALLLDRFAFGNLLLRVGVRAKAIGG